MLPWQLLLRGKKLESYRFKTGLTGSMEDAINFQNLKNMNFQEKGTKIKNNKLTFHDNVPKFCPRNITG